MKHEQTIPSDTRLLMDWRAGDDSAFETLFLRHYERICAVLYRMLGNRTDAEDATQRVFLKLYRAPERIRLQHERASVIGWLYRTAVNEGYDLLRRQKRRAARIDKFARLWPFGDSAPDPAQVAESQDTQAQVRHILAELKPREAKLLLLRHAGLSYKELAIALDVAPGSVGSLLTRAERAFERKYRRVFGDEA